MKKIINGKSYDTETATKIAEKSSGHHADDFNYVHEALYKTTKGAYFVHGEGGPGTEYRSIQGREPDFGEDIIPLSLEQAFAWCERTGNSEAGLKNFAVEEA